MLATVVVCTRNRAALLRGCLAAVAADTSALEREVLVVDNGSTDDTRAVVEEYGVRYVREERPGIARARNAGVAHARGDLVLMTDDDARVHDGWADAIAAPLADPRVAATGGRVVPVFVEPPPGWLDGPMLRLLAHVDLGPEPRDTRPTEFFVSANMGIRRAAAAALAPPFDVTMGHRDGVGIAHEETHFLRRLRAAGHTVRWVPSAVADHVIPPHRATRESLRRAAFQNGFGMARAARAEGRLEAAAVLAARYARHAVQARLARSRPDSRPNVEADLRAHQRLGYATEGLLGRWPDLSDRAAAR